MRPKNPFYNKLLAVPVLTGLAIGSVGAADLDDAAEMAGQDVGQPEARQGLAAIFDSSSEPLFSQDEFLKQAAALTAEADALVNFDFASRANQILSSQAMGVRSQDNQIRTYELARAQGMTTSGKDGNGRNFSLAGFRPDGTPQYRIEYNFTSRITQGVDLISVGTELDLDGLGYMVGVWDGGRVLENHIEFDDRVNQEDDAPDMSDHATHVIGTICAAGELPLAMGMAPGISVSAYDWEGDLGEMAGVAATNRAGGISDILVSNHSYGLRAGWVFIGGDPPMWGWMGDPAPGRHDPNWGRYSANSAAVDGLVHLSQYYLPVYAAGNSGNQEGPAEGDSWEDLAGGGGDNYRPGIDPERVIDRMGYDTIGSGANAAKNVLTVGATHDGVAGYDEEFEQPADARFLNSSGNPNGERDQDKVEITGFSSRGPTDDGRLKPEVVANGAGLLSCTTTGLAGYARFSGTSMAAPSVTGAIALLQQLAREEGNRSALRSDEVRGLLCHTAYDLGNPGPDYIHGFGLVDAEKAANMIMRDRSTLVPGDSKQIQQGLVSLVPGIDYRLAQYDMLVGGGEPLKITLTWIDPAGDPKAGANNRERVLVNDLDMRLVSPSGEIIRPWVLNWENPDEDATTGDNNLDNIEQIYIENPESGAYSLLIIADRFDGDTGRSQLFSLITSGAGKVLSTPVTIEAPADPVEWPFEIVPIDEDDVPDSISRIMAKVITVYNIPIYGSAHASNTKMKVAADVLAEYIDNDEDGLADNGAVTGEMNSTGSMVLMFASEAEFNTALEAGDVDISFLASPNIKIMFADQVHKSLPKKEVEESRSKLLSMMLRGGFSTYDRYEDIFEETSGTVISNLMRNAQGTTERKPTYEIPGWYHLRSTSIRRLSSTYFYYVVGSRIGLFDAKGVGRRIDDEWELYTEDKLRGGDPFAFDLVNKPIYSMPRRLPDGDYDPDNPPAIPFF